jgi:hypothetical protein
MKSLVSLWQVLAEELGQLCATSTSRDLKTVRDRVKAEGTSFLTITLPAFGKAFERCLEQGYVAPGDFPGFRLSSGPLPLFLGGFLEQCFDKRTGLICSDESVDCIDAIRQLTHIYGKLQLPASSQRIKQAFTNYVRIEKEVRQDEHRLAIDDYNRLAIIGTVLFGDCFSATTRQIDDASLQPRHGPGATADRKSSNQRFRHQEWPDRVEQIFPFLEYALPSSSYYHELDRVHFLDPCAERPVRVTYVHKTQKAPRIIAIEPSSMQYVQQALSASLTSGFESSRIPGNTRDNLCYSMIGFTDQLPNRELAKKGSYDGSLATLDLSDASDRVSVRHVSALLANFPLLRDACLAARSTTADVPGFGVMPLSKYASMGSALTFPLEAAVFLAVVFVGICEARSPTGLRREILSYKGSVRVYGDDIIVPVDKVDRVTAALELFGFRVNTGKSFWNGKFRESCGGDYYAGRWVTPIRLGHVFPSSHTDASEVVSLVEFRNHAYERGYWKTAHWLDSRIEPVLNGFYPFVESTSSVIGRRCFLGLEPSKKRHAAYQSPLVKGYAVKAQSPVDKLDDWPALLKFFLKKGSDPLMDGHLERSGRPRAVSTKLGWMSPL